MTRRAGVRAVQYEVRAERMRVQGFHYPFPAEGFVERDGNRYRLAPTP
jgi:hypothetical protein